MDKYNEEFDNRIRSSKKEIEKSDLNNSSYIYAKAKMKRENNVLTIFKSSLFSRYAISVLLITLIVICSIGVFKENKGNIIIGNQSGNNFNVSEAYSNDVKKVTSLSEIKNLILNSYSNNLEFDEDASFEKPENGGINSSPESPGIDTDHSYETNVREEAVDEADIVKVNGDYIYYVTKAIYQTKYIDGEYQIIQIGENALHILKANGDELETVKKIVFADGEKEIARNDEAVVTDYYEYYPLDLLYTDKYIVLTIYVNAYSNTKYNDQNNRSNYRTYTEYYIYDINTYEQITNINVPGYRLSSRLIGNQLYIVNNYNDYKYNDYANCLPQYGVNDAMYEASLNNIYYCPAFGLNINSYIIIFRITLDTDIMVEDFYFLAPSVNNLYVNENAIYLIRTYSNEIEKENNVVTNWPVSRVIIINIEDGMKFDGYLEIKGRISNDYWIDEYQGFLRVASTGTRSSYKLVDDKYAYDRISCVFNYLTIFTKDEKGRWYEASGIKEGLGEVGESIKSAYFNGTTATIVTFRQTDPLYYVDLTDHYNPVITSELKVSGFTVYQHPYKDNYVIGIGYETNENGSTIGYKVALYDISDKTNIKQVGDAIVFSSINVNYEKDYYTPDVLSDPKELFLDLDNSIFGFTLHGCIRKPVSVADPGYNSYTTYTCDYFDELCLFRIDLTNENPLSIYHSEYIQLGERYHKEIDRMIFIKDKYYLLNLQEIYIYRLTYDKLELIDKKPLV